MTQLRIRLTEDRDRVAKIGPLGRQEWPSKRLRLFEGVMDHERRQRGADRDQNRLDLLAHS